MIRLGESSDNKLAFVRPRCRGRCCKLPPVKGAPQTTFGVIEFRVTVRGAFVIDLSSCRSEKAADRNGQPWQPLQSTAARDRRGLDE
jgi:hypothetical protein